MELTLNHKHEYETKGHNIDQDDSIYLLTFWPPGPDERLNVTSHSLFGIESMVKLESQLRAADISSAVGAAVCD